MKYVDSNPQDPNAGTITLTFDKSKGSELSSTGKMRLLNDAPRGWHEVDPATGLNMSVNIGFKIRKA